MILRSFPPKVLFSAILLQKQRKGLELIDNSSQLNLLSHSLKTSHEHTPGKTISLYSGSVYPYLDQRHNLCYSLSSDLLDFLIWFPFSGIFVCLIKTTSIIAKLCQDVWEITLLFILKKSLQLKPPQPHFEI